MRVTNSSSSRATLSLRRSSAKSVSSPAVGGNETVPASSAGTADGTMKGEGDESIERERERENRIELSREGERKGGREM